MKSIRTYSKSIPSRLYCCTSPTMAFTKAVRLLSVAMHGEKYWEPDQPPSDRKALTF